MSEASHVEWLLENSGPVIRYRTAHELIGGVSSSEERKLRRDLLECAEVQKWLHALESCKRLGGSKDSSAVNSIAKLAAYGLTADMPELRHLLEATRAKFYLDTPRKPGDPSHLQWQPATLYPMFISVGHLDRPEVIEYAESRLDAACEYAKKTSADDRDDLDGLLLTQAEKETLGIAGKWREKHIWNTSILRVIPGCF